jgi:pyruvate/2-oxoglutarate dehydrogenase complex dihydrolipoamide acyltransferase (E2) component
LKPLFKIVLYAESATPITKGIYLRRREDLILRVQARSPNDDDGIYQLRFGGSFAPVIGGPEIGAGDTPAADMPATATAGKKTRRVSSVGARIEEPAPAVSEVAAAPTPEPTPVETASVEPPKEKPAVVETPKPTPPRSARSRRPVGRRGTARATAKPKETATAKKTDTTEGENAEPGSTQPEPESATKTATTTKSGRRATSESAAKSAEAPSEPEAESGPRLIIQTSAGTLINRPMSGVRRVTIENGQVFVVSKDGRTLRIPLANIAKMSIEP